MSHEEKGLLPLTEAVVTRRILLPSEADLLPLFGRNDENLRALESLLALRIVARGNEIILKGEEPRVARAERLLTQLSDLVHAGTPIHSADVRAALRMLGDDEAAAQRVPNRLRFLANLFEHEMRKSLFFCRLHVPWETLRASDDRLVSHGHDPVARGI